MQFSLPATIISLVDSRSVQIIVVVHPACICEHRLIIDVGASGTSIVDDFDHRLHN
jgi:hypothetical protein